MIIPVFSKMLHVLRHGGIKKPNPGTMGNTQISKTERPIPCGINGSKTDEKDTFSQIGFNPSRQQQQQHKQIEQRTVSRKLAQIPQSINSSSANRWKKGQLLANRPPYLKASAATTQTDRRKHGLSQIHGTSTAAARTHRNRNRLQA